MPNGPEWTVTSLSEPPSAPLAYMGALADIALRIHLVPSTATHYRAYVQRLRFGGVFLFACNL